MKEPKLDSKHKKEMGKHCSCAGFKEMEEKKGEKQKKGGKKMQPCFM